MRSPSSGPIPQSNSAKRMYWMTNSQNLWIGVSRGFLINSLVSGSFDEFALFEPGAGADEGD